MIRSLSLTPKVSLSNRSVFFRPTDEFEDIVASLEALTVSDVDEAASGNRRLMDQYLGLY